MRKIAIITGTRADYSRLKPIIQEIKKHEDLQPLIIATGTHFLKKFGNTYKEIEKDFKIDKKLPTFIDEDSNSAMSLSLAKTTEALTTAFKELNPDIVFVMGDRIEALAAATSAAIMNIPLAHSHGGEVTGTIDESLRHAITKLSHIHFPATQQSAERIKKLGEDPSKVFLVGSPGIDALLSLKLIPKQELSKKYNFDINKPLLLLVQHPVTTQSNEAAEQMQITMQAISELKHQTIVISPNSDAGGRSIIEVIKKYSSSLMQFYPNIPHLDYISLLSISSAIIGNSSSALLEAPSFKIPAVNIGIRQQTRERANNVINVPHDKQEIINALNKALSKEFKESLKNCKNPYGSGNASKKIADILSKIEINKSLIQKHITY